MRLPLPFCRKKPDLESEFRGISWIQKRLSKSIPELEEGSVILLDSSRDVLKGYAAVRLIPRLNAQPKISDLGTEFSLCYEMLEKEMRIFSITPGFPELLEQHYELERWSVPVWKKYGAFFIPRYERDALECEYRLNRGIEVVFGLPENSMFLFAATLDQDLKKRMASRGRNIGDLFLIKVAVYSDDREVLERCVEHVKRFICAPVRVRVKKLLFEEFYGSLVPPKMPRFGIRVMSASHKTISEIPLLPVAGMPLIGYSRSAKMLPVEINRGQILLGRVEGRPFSIDVRDLFRHAYLVGQTGSGKTNLLKLLIKRLHDLKYPVFVIDPHGELSEEIACTISDSVFLHPIYSPFSINPLELPAMDSAQKVLLGIDELISLFTNVFNLPESAVNVKYILQTVTREIYGRGEVPTLAGLYNTLASIYSSRRTGKFRFLGEEEEILKSIPEKSFISALSRLQSFAKDEILRRLTSSTTVDMGRLMEEGRTVLFSLPQRHIGSAASALIASTLLLKLYHTRLMRYDRKRDEHAFVVIDEFQNVQGLPVLTTILSEARKFGLHLILAHQYAEQLNREVLQAVMTNAGIKFIFSVSGSDAETFAEIDPGFWKEVKSIISSLPVGHCVVKLSAKKGDQSLPPLLLEVDEFREKPLRSLREACTNEFSPGWGRACSGEGGTFRK